MSQAHTQARRKPRTWAEIQLPGNLRAAELGLKQGLDPHLISLGHMRIVGWVRESLCRAYSCNNVRHKIKSTPAPKKAARIA